MIIFSFDCAIKNLGFCCIEFDEKWRDKICKLNKELSSVYSNIDNMEKLEFVEILTNIIDKISNVVDNLFKLIFANTIDLLHDKNSKKTKFTEVLKNLKYVVACLNNQLPKPDIVLIETQMAVNDKARSISRYIEDIYSSIEMPNLEISYLIKHYPIIPIKIKEKPHTKVYYIHPTIKNA